MTALAELPPVTARLVRASEIRLGDDIRFAGRVHRVRAIVPYRHPDPAVGEGHLALCDAGWSIVLYPDLVLEVEGPSSTVPA